MHLGCSSRMRTEIWDDFRNPLSDVFSDSVFRRSNSVFASQKPYENSILRRLNLRRRHSEDFWRHLKFRFASYYCTPSASQDGERVIALATYASSLLNSKFKSNLMTNAWLQISICFKWFWLKMASLTLLFRVKLHLLITDYSFKNIIKISINIFETGYISLW